MFCSNCQNPVCVAHSQPIGGDPGRVRCLSCAGLGSPSDDTSEGSGLSPSQRWIAPSDLGGSRGKSPRSQTSADETLEIGSDDLASDEFSAEDIASFDEISEADKRLKKSDVYDS